MSLAQSIRLRYGPTIQKLTYAAGLLRPAEGALVLMYHSVADAPESQFIDPANHVPVDIFARQMEFLASKRQVVALDELMSTLQQGKTPDSGTIAITFDDGYLDNLTVAAQILERYTLPATLFLPTGYIDRGESQWVDQAYSAFKFRSKSELSWDSEVATTSNLDDPKQHRASYRTVCDELLRARAAERKLLLNELNIQLRPTARPPRLTMNWDEVRTLVNKHRGFQIGGHTLEHTDLSAVPEEEAQKELTICAQRIKEELAERPRHFSFCYGRTSESLRRLAAAAGFEAACGGEGLDPVIKAPADLLRLPRVAGPASMQRFDLLTSASNTGIWRRLGR